MYTGGVLIIGGTVCVTVAAHRRETEQGERTAKRQDTFAQVPAVDEEGAFPRAGRQGSI